MWPIRPRSKGSRTCASRRSGRSRRGSPASKRSTASPRNRPLLRIGLTGGIGSGKSTVAALFARRGVPVIDADELGRELIEPGGAAFAPILAAFGSGMQLADGSLDRRALRTLLAADPAARRTLEALLHPLIRAQMQRRTEALADACYCLWVVPLLLEAGWRDAVDRVLVVDVPIEIQLERALHRDGVGEAEVRGIIAAQIPREKRLAAADEVIRNEGAPELLQSQVEALHRKYLALADN